MNIRWHEADCREDEMIFKTFREAEVWADSISNAIYDCVFDGYVTPDEKVTSALTFCLAQVKHFNVHAEKALLNDEYIYKVWISRLSN